MNVKELIKKIEALPTEDYKYSPWIDKKLVLGLIRQLDEPEKVKVSEEEAKFLETFDFNCEIDVTEALYYVSRTGWGYYLEDNNGIELKELSEGFRELENRKRLIKAILFGYEVEKEKRYTVVMKETKQPLYYNAVDKKLFFSLAEIASHFTRQQLKKLNFDWVFDCEGIEVKEVTE